MKTAFQAINDNSADAYARYVIDQTDKMLKRQKSVFRKSNKKQPEPR